MKAELVEQAAKIIPEPQMLINVVSRRVAHMGNANIALTEIVEGKLVYHAESDSLQEDSQ